METLQAAASDRTEAGRQFIQPSPRSTSQREYFEEKLDTLYTQVYPALSTRTRLTERDLHELRYILTIASNHRCLDDSQLVATFNRLQLLRLA